MANAAEETVLPPRDAVVLEAVERLLSSGDDVLRIAAATGEVELPGELRSVLSTVVASMRRGQAVTIVPHAMRLTTQQAADLLGVSRPTLVKLLEDGRIPYETPNRHRRIRLADLLDYQATRQAERRQALDDLTAAAQQTGTYDRTVDDYQAALAAARRKLA